MHIMHGGSGEGGKRQAFSPTTAVNAYRSWIYAAANLNAVAVASSPLRLYVKRRNGTKLWQTRRTDRRTKAYLAGDAAQRPSVYAMRKAAEYGDDYEVVTDSHPVLELLSKVNPYQNGFDLAVLRVLYGELTGNAYLHPVIDQRLGIPTELWVMPSQYTEVVPGKEKFIDGYLYGASREQRRFFAEDEVIHFKRPNPADLYYGIGKLEAAWGVAMMNMAAHEMDLGFFENKARPDYLLTIKTAAHPDEIERLEAQIDEKLRGARRTGRFLTATADIDVKPLSFAPKDLAGRDEVVEEIAAIFGVPVSMLKANDPNLASATAGYAMWRETTVLPLLRMDEEVLNQKLLPLFGIDEDAFLAYDNPVPSDRMYELQARQASVAGGWRTANEARAEEGQEPVDDPMADRLLVGGAPLGGPPAPPAPQGVPFGAASVETVEAPSAELPQPETKDALSDCVSEKIPTLIEEGYDRDQAVAIAYSMCSEGKSLEAVLSERAPSAETKAISDIDTKPPKTVADNARRALEVRAGKPESERGMTAVGLARARDLANRVSLSEDTIRRMLAYFERHQSDKEGSTWDEQGKGWQAWNGWGGDDGWTWARRKVEEFNRERERKAARKSCGCGCGSGISQKALWDEAAPAFGGILTKASREDAEDEFEDITDEEREIASSVSKVLDRQAQKVIEKINAAGAPTAELVTEVETLLKSSRWNEQLVSALRPYLQNALESGIGLGIDTVQKIATSAPNFTPIREDLKAYAQSESVRLARRAATGVNRYTSVRVGEILGDGIAEGETVEQLAGRVREWAGEKGDAARATRKRALTIARTEAQRASRAAEVEAWKATGIVEGKTWLLAPDPCEFCEAASKSFSDNAVSIDEPFYQKGEELEGADGGKLTLDYEAVDGPPLHPNCRCSLQPRLIDDYENLFRELDAELEAKEADE